MSDNNNAFDFNEIDNDPKSSKPQNEGPLNFDTDEEKLEGCADTKTEGAEAHVESERVVPIYVPPVVPSSTPISPQANPTPSQNPATYGGFSQKKNYEKACRKGNGFKILAIVMTALFVITATVFATYYVTVSNLGKNTDGVAEPAGTSADISSEHPVYVEKDLFSSIDGQVHKAEDREDSEIKATYTGEVLTRQELIQFASPSVVGIKTQMTGYSFFGPSVYEGVGSGFVLTESGYIVTNHHVIENASAIKVILENGNEYEAKLIGSDEPSDLAVLKIEPTETLIPVVIGDSDKVVAGDSVIAIGCPSGIELSGTATSGMISKAKRTLSITDDYGRFVKTLYVIQIDAPINPGNSGGPLLNDRGEVIGINTLKLSSGYEGIGFALPINGVIDIVEQLCEEGVVTSRGESSYVKGKAALGITYDEITEYEAKNYQVPQGVIVILATRGGAAQKYGIKSGDIIIGYNGDKIVVADDLISALNASAPGDEVIITVWRDDSAQDITVVLGESA